MGIIMEILHDHKESSTGSLGGSFEADNMFVHKINKRGYCCLHFNNDAG